jgi:hypothetical protein
MAGGIGLGLQDAVTKQWISYHGYNGPTRNGDLALDAELSRAHRVRIILTNFAPRNSTWTVAHVALRPAPLPTSTRFATAIPTGWSLAGGATASPAGGSVHITTGAGPYEYALVSPSGYLKPGRHVVTASVHVLVGGFGVGVLGVRSNKWLAYHNFSSNSALGAERMAVSLATGEMARVVLTNYGDKVLRRSDWDLASLAVK